MKNHQTELVKSVVHSRGEHIQIFISLMAVVGTVLALAQTGFGQTTNSIMDLSSPDFTASGRANINNNGQVLFEQFSLTEGGIFLYSDGSRKI